LLDDDYNACTGENELDLDVSEYNNIRYSSLNSYLKSTEVLQQYQQYIVASKLDIPNTVYPPYYLVLAQYWNSLPNTVALVQFFYDCSSYAAGGYPEVCHNTYCALKYYLKVAPSSTTNNFYNVYYCNAKTCGNKRSISLSGLPTSPGKDRDEFPLNSFYDGGCFARIEAITPSDNRRHGGKIGNFYKNLKKTPGCATLPCAFQMVFPPITDPGNCYATDYRVQKGSWYKQSTCGWITGVYTDCPTYASNCHP